MVKANKIELNKILNPQIAFIPYVNRLYYF